LDTDANDRPAFRFVAPPPELSEEKKEQLIRGQTGRFRKKSSRLQKELPLEIVFKGRFEKSEPTIRRGEDLDVPTYIRRGVPLN
jgi:cell division protein FtsZ